MVRGVILLVSGASATLHVPFILHSFACMFLHVPFICMHIPFMLHSCPVIFLSFSFHVPFICIYFRSFSFYIPFIFIPMCIHVLSSSFHWTWLHGLARGPSATNGYIAKLSLRLSPNNPSNIWHCSKENCHRNDRVRERASSMPNDMVTAGNRAQWAP